MAADWNKIRKEYIKGGTSYRKLAAKYGVSRTAIEHHARDEHWQSGKSQVKAKTMAKTVDAVAGQEARIDTGIYDAADYLLQVFRKSITAMDESGILTPDMVREYGSALRQIQLVMDSKPTGLDLEEQKARIAKLQKDAAPEESRHKTITVNLGGMEQYAK